MWLRVPANNDHHTHPIPRTYLLGPHRLGHLPRGDAARQTLGDGRFAHPGLPDQHRVVLRPPAQHLFVSVWIMGSESGDP